MRIARALFLLAIVTSAFGVASATDVPPDPPAIEDLKRRVLELERIVAEQQATIHKLLGDVPAAAEPSELEKQLAAETGASAVAPPAPAPSGPAPIQVLSGASGRNYLNLSLDGLIAAGASTEPDVPALEPGGHDPAQRGFTVQNVEAVFEGAVDPYFRAQANVVLQITPDGETNVELEEVYATTSSLPHNLQVKAGQFFTEFGRINPSHPHSWDYVNAPLVEARMFGPDGLRSAGVRASWLLPTPFYSELFFAVLNGHGETLTSFGSVPGDAQFGRPVEALPVTSLDDLLYAPRWTASFDPTDTQTLLVGASAALGPNGTGSEADTRIYGVDAFWKWKPARANKGFPFVKLQAEGMTRRFEAAATPALPPDTFHDRGAYAQAVWGFRPGWTAGARYDVTSGDSGDDPLDPRFENRRRASAALTWFPTEYSKLRLQYDFDDRDVYKDASSFWLQLEFLLGAHAAHKF